MKHQLDAFFENIAFIVGKADITKYAKFAFE